MSFAVIAEQAGTQCPKCKGSGQYGWTKVVQGRTVREAGTCFSCGGIGKQSASQISRNITYNRYKLAEV